MSRRSRQEKASKSAKSPQSKPQQQGRASSSGSAGNDATTLPAWASTRRTVIYAIVALILCAIFIYQITREDSLLGGIMGWELQKFNGGKPGQPTWKDLGDEYRREAAQMPGYREHEAVRQLLIVVDYVHRGRLDAGRVLDQAKIWAAEDPDNLVSRLALAYLTDKTHGTAGGSLQQRFEIAKKIVDGEKEPSQATLHQDVFNHKWYDILKRHIKRKDVAISAARHIPVETHAHIAALPTIVSWLNSVIGSLRKEGNKQRAEECAGWMILSLQRIPDTEHDSAVCLLCADLLSSSLSEEFPLRSHLRKVRSVFHSKSDASPIDPVDIYKCPSDVEFISYYACVICPAAAAAIGVGAFICVIFGSISSGLVRPPIATNGNPVASKSTQRAALFLLPILAVFPAAMANDVGCLGRGLVSQNGLIATFMFWALYGALLPVACAAFLLGKHGDRLKFVVFLCLVSIVLMPMIPAKYWLSTLRVFDLHGGSILYVAALLISIFLIMLVWTPQSSRLVPHIAARVLLWSMIWALVGHQLARSAEQIYLRQYDWRWNEMALRYGDNWNTMHFNTTQNDSTTQP